MFSFIDKTVILWAGFEICLRVFLSIAYIALDKSRPMYAHPKLQTINIGVEEKETISDSFVIIIAFVILIYLVIHAVIVTRYRYNYLLENNFELSSEMGDSNFFYYIIVDFLQIFFAYTMSLLVCGVLTNILKNAVGKYRPGIHIFCAKVLKVPDVDACSALNDPRLLDYRKSFPSGHASIAFASATFVTLYVYHRGVRLTAYAFRPIPVVLTLLTPLFASWIAGTRISDGRHDPYDVLAGTFLGIVVTILCYLHYFGNPCHKDVTKGFLNVPLSNEDNRQNSVTFFTCCFENLFRLKQEKQLFSKGRLNSIEA
jgi:membrane-associated phospholipid phosphatase